MAFVISFCKDSVLASMLMLWQLSWVIITCCSCYSTHPQSYDKKPTSTMEILGEFTFGVKTY